MRLLIVALTLALAWLPQNALAWGAEGHEIVAAIAMGFMSPEARAKAMAILKDDTNGLTKSDILSRSIWADAFRANGGNTTASWHFAEIDIAKPDLDAACFHFPAVVGVASRAIGNDCVVNKIEEFAKELRDPATSASERVFALKYLLHFVGNLHQPLHVSGNQDHGGNCVMISLAAGRTSNLHAYWDITVLEPLGADPLKAAQALYDQITPEQKAQWAEGSVRDWAMEGFKVAKASVYTLGSKPGCDGGQGPITLPADYAETATKVAAVQLQKAGVRLALVLNRSLGG